MIDLNLKKEDKLVLLAGYLSPAAGCQNDFVLGVFSSELKLSEAVDYWMKEFPELVFHYRIVREDWTKADASYGWDWVYIPLSSTPESLGAGGGPVPTKEFWGKNLIALDYGKNYVMTDCLYTWWDHEI